MELGRMSLVFAALALASSATVAQTSPAACAHPIRIGAWNIKYLGKPAGVNQPRQHPSDIASYVRASGVDLLALEEIGASSSDAAGRPRNAKLDEAFALLNQGGARKWRYQLFDKHPQDGDPSTQRTGIAWNERRVRPTGGPWPLQVSADAQRENELRSLYGADAAEPGPLVLRRWATGMKFRAGSSGGQRSDWVVVPLHLKSNRGSNAPQGNPNVAVRSYEAELIVRGLDALKPAFGDLDVVLLGDVNTESGTEPAVARLREAGWTDCHRSDESTWLGGNLSPFDRIFVSSERPSTASSCASFSVFRPAQWRSGMSNSAFMNLLSDHAMVRATLCALQDDD